MPSSSPDILTLLFVATAILIGILGLFIFAMVRENRRIIRWQRERIKAEIDTLEAERKRIAGDLHDELGPMLSAIKMQVGNVEPEDPQDQEILKKSKGHIDQVIQRFRDISYNLMPNILVRKGLFTAIEDYVQKMSGLNGLTIMYRYDKGIALEDTQALNLYRMIQEITHNTLKHAKATELSIGFRKTPDGLHFSTADNGTGFQFQEKSRHGAGLGLMNIISRAEVLGGDLKVISGQGSGTRFEFDMRLPASQQNT